MNSYLFSDIVAYLKFGSYKVVICLKSEKTRMLNNKILFESYLHYLNSFGWTVIIIESSLRICKTFGAYLISLGSHIS